MNVYVPGGKPLSKKLLKMIERYKARKIGLNDVAKALGYKAHNSAAVWLLKQGVMIHRPGRPIRLRRGPSAAAKIVRMKKYLAKRKSKA